MAHPWVFGFVFAGDLDEAVFALTLDVFLKLDYPVYFPCIRLGIRERYFKRAVRLWCIGSIYAHAKV
ncbi:MAG: hypothetical protein WCX45_06615 [Candidatus Gracilibacteria bacterium]